MTQALVALRNAVKPSLAQLEAGDVVLVAVSGGADSLALAYAVLMEATPLAVTPVAITIDHQLQENSAVQAEKVSKQLKEMGYENVFIEKVVVTTESGLEAGARSARYQALDASADKEGAVKIFLGHTRDDQAETVLLGLARGSGARSLSGMAAENGKYLRPFLQVTRQETEDACKELGLEIWNDPHNFNADFTRVKVRREILPLMESKLGPGISAALARTAGLLRDDADALDGLAAAEISHLNLTDIDCEYLAALPRALRTRVIRAAIYACGAPEGSITADHVAIAEALVTSWRGQGALSLPGGVKVERISGRLSLLAQPTRPLPFDQGVHKVDLATVGTDVEKVIATEEQLKNRIAELAAQVDADYKDKNVLLVGVLKGAIMAMADLTRAMQSHIEMDWMAVSSYGSGTKSSGVVRILKDLDRDITGRHVLIVEDIVDTGLTLSWLTANLLSRGAASVEILTILRKPEAAKVEVKVKYVGFDIPTEFVVGYGLDFDEKYRNLSFIGVLSKHMYS